jgi:hypothetical protein
MHVFFYMDESLMKLLFVLDSKMASMSEQPGACHRDRRLLHPARIGYPPAGLEGCSRCDANGETLKRRAV